MKKAIKKLMAITLALSMLLSLVSVLPAFAAEGDPELVMAIANRIDVALAVGPTSVDYSTFEADLRAALKDGRDHPVPDEDVYILASQAVSASTTAEFSWWTYDHTRPAPTYGGVSSYNDTTHTYIEAPTNAATSTASATYLQNGTGVNYAPGVWGPGNPTTATAIVNTVGAANYVPGIGYQYEDVNKAPNYYPIDKFEMNPDPLNPDLAYYNTTSTRRLYHPYQGNNTHMVASNSGATMDFYGYPRDSYRDWQFLPNDQKTLKTFEFSIAEDRAFDALDGVGFFFNTEVNGSYATGTQTMSGYLLFLQYNASGVGESMTIYKFKDINTKDFHHAMDEATGDATKNTVAGYNGTMNATNSTAYKPLLIPVARSLIYNATDFSRRIRIEASPTQVKVYYKGSTVKNDATVLDPFDPGYTELTDSDLVNFNSASVTPVTGYTVALEQGEVIPMDPAYIGPDTTEDADYGFGPMGAYRAHGCARPTHIAMQNLSMTVEKVKSLTEVVREPEWHENTYKYLVNLNEYEIEDFVENAVIAELLARLTNDDIYYVGWGSTINAIASAAFLRKHSLKGTIIDIEDLEELKDTTEWGLLETSIQDSYLGCIQEALTYEEQIKAIADEIYSRYWGDEASNHALVTDNVVMTVTGVDMQNTIDDIWPSGKWMIEHYTDEEPIIIAEHELEGITYNTYMTNFLGAYPTSGQYMDELFPSYTFPLPGLYRIYYRDLQVGELIVHRAPVASFEVTLVAGKPTFVSTSHDPDVYDPGGINGGEMGIKNEAWGWIDLDDPLMPEAEEGLPETLIEGHSYIITLTVEDDWGAKTSISQLIGLSDAGTVLPPFADFTLAPSLFIKSANPAEQSEQMITLNNKSVDPGGLLYTSEWTVFKDDVLYTGFTITEGDFTGKTAEIVVGDQLAGHYKVVLVVTNSEGKESAAVARFFDIVEDLIAPTAAISLPGTPPFIGNTTVTLTFSDTGGSGYKNCRYAVVTVGVSAPAPSAPASGSSAWRAESPSASRNVTLNTVGDNYVFWEAWDNAGNKGSGVFGPYEMQKDDVTINLVAEPQDGSEVVYGTLSQGITLTATIDVDDPMPTGTVIFYQGTTPLASATVNASGVATWTGNPASVGTGLTFRAVYQGDANYNSGAEASDICDIAKNPDASVTISAQSQVEDRIYDATPYEPTGIFISPAIEHTIMYEGRAGTTYGPSATSPTDVGKYTVTVTTTNPNYEVKSASADFEILPRELALTLTTSPDPSLGSEAQSTVTLTGTISNAVDLPAGNLRFYVDGVLIATKGVTASDQIAYDGDTYTYAVSAAWSGMVSGDYTLTLEYIPATVDNYIADGDIIEDYSIGKLNQTVSVTSPYNVTYGDAPFTIAPATGLSTGTATYVLISGGNVVAFDPATRLITIIGAGSAVIRATQPGDANYNPATADIRINVAKKTWILEIGVLDDVVEYGSDVEPYVVTNEIGAAVTYIYEGNGGTVYGPSSIPPVAVGKYKVKAVAASTENYLSEESAYVSFEITPAIPPGSCACAITGIGFNGDTFTIPYYSLRKSVPLTAIAGIDPCDDYPEHNLDLFGYCYEIVSLSAPSGSARVDNSTGRLIVYGVEPGDTVYVTVKVTATHAPTGISLESAPMVFTFTKEVVQPAEPPVAPDPNGPDATDDSGYIDKNEVDTVKLDMPAVGTVTSLSYTAGPDHDDMVAQRGTEILYEYADYDIDFSSTSVIFTLDFFASLHTGFHWFRLEVYDGLSTVSLTFCLFIPEGNLIVDVDQNPGAPTVTGNTGYLESEELQKQEIIDEMELGYNIYIYLVIDQATDMVEKALIENNKGNMIVGAILDIALIKRMRDEATGQYVDENIHEVDDNNIDDKIWLVIDIPPAIRGFTNYVVVRAHTDPVTGDTYYEELLPTELINNGTQLRFPSDKFSTFAILYEANTDPSYYGDLGDAGADRPADPPSDNVALRVSERIKETLQTEDHIKYINGYSDGTVRPDKPITRAEVAAIFFRLIKDPSKNDAVSGRFSDVANGAWYAQAVNYLARMGILEGYEDGSFKPDRNITRAEFATITSRFDDMANTAENPFSDVRTNHWAYGNILSAFAKGWVTGYAGGEFRPQNSITRAEVIAIVNRMLGRQIEKEDVPRELHEMYSDLPTSHWAFSDIIEASVDHEYERKADGFEIWTVFGDSLP